VLISLKFSAGDSWTSIAAPVNSERQAFLRTTAGRSGNVVSKRFAEARRDNQMKRPLMIIAFGYLIFGFVAAAFNVQAQGGLTARANQHPVNHSGVKGKISFTQTSAGLIVTGTAKGLAPSTEGRYVSLVYDVGSNPGGPDVCEPTIPIDGMFVGIWISDAAGNGLLIQVAPPGAIAPLGSIDTISIRDTTINEGFGLEAVVACGEIAVNP